MLLRVVGLRGAARPPPDSSEPGATTAPAAKARPQGLGGAPFQW